MTRRTESLIPGHCFTTEAQITLWGGIYALYEAR